MKQRREPFYEELGRRVARLRQQRRITQHELAAMMQPQMTRASVANIETGQQRVLAHTLVQLAAALGCDLDTLAGAIEAPQPEADAVQRELEQMLKKERIPKDVVDALSRSLRLPSAARTR